MTQVDAIKVRLEGDSRGLDQTLDRSEDRLERFGRQAQTVARRVGEVGAAMGVAGAAAAAFVVQIARTADEIGKASQTAAVTTAQLQTLRFAFGQLAGTVDAEVDGAFRRFNRRLGLAREGATTYKEAFDDLGVSLQQTTSEALEVALIKIAEIEDASRRAAVASEVFGEDAGPKLAAALGNGIDAVNSLRDALERDGGVISDENIRRAEAFNDQMDRLSRTVTAELANSTLDNAEALQTLAEGFGAVAAGAIDALGALSDFGSQLGTTIAEVQAAIESDPLRELAEMIAFLRNPGAAIGAGMAGGEGGSGGPRFTDDPESFLPTDSSVFGGVGGEGEEDDPLGKAGKGGPINREKMLKGVETEVEQRARLLEKIRDVEEEHQEALARIQKVGADKIQKQEVQTLQQRASDAANYLAQITATAATENKAMFQINKAAALASAALDAREAVSGAYKVGARIGGPPLGSAFAVAAAAAQAANISAIASTSYNSGGGNIAPSVGPTAAPAVTPVGAAPGNAGGQGVGGVTQTLTVEGISDDALFSGSRVRALADQLLEFQRDGGQVILEGS